MSPKDALTRIEIQKHQAIPERNALAGHTAWINTAKK
jgi:hypothetical protein